MTGGYDDLGQVGTVATHWFRKAGIYRLTGVVASAVQEEDREGKLAAVLCLASVGDIGGGIHVPGIGAIKAVAGECGGIDRKVFLRDDLRVTGDRRSLFRAAEPAVIATHLGSAGGFAPCGRVALAEERADSAFDVGFERGAGTLEIFLVKKLVLPLTGRIGGLGIDLAVDEGNQVGDGEAIGDVGDAEIGDGAAMLGVMAGDQTTGLPQS